MVGVVLSAHEVEIIVTLLGGGGSCLSDYVVTRALLWAHFHFKQILFVFLLSPLPFPYFVCVHACTSTCALVCMWKSFYHTCARDQA